MTMAPQVLGRHRFFRKPTMDHGLKNWLRIGFLAMIWGSAFMVTEIAIRGFGPISVAAGRILFGAVLLFFFARARGLSLPSFADRTGRLTWLFAFGFGMFSMAVPFFLLSWGQAYVASGFAGVTMATVPLLVLPLAHLLVPGERLTPGRAIGFAIGFAGAIVLIGLDAFQARGTDLEALGRIACFGAAMCYATGSIVTRLAPRVDPIAFAATATFLAAMVIVPAALIIEGVPAEFPLPSLLAIVYLGAVPTAAANLLIVAVVQSAGPSFLSLANYQVPVWSVIFGSVFLHESLPARILVALALILSGLAFSQWAGRRGV